MDRLTTDVVAAEAIIDGRGRLEQIEEPQLMQYQTHPSDGGLSLPIKPGMEGSMEAIKQDRMGRIERLAEDLHSLIMETKRIQNKAP